MEASPVLVQWSFYGVSDPSLKPRIRHEKSSREANGAYPQGGALILASQIIQLCTQRRAWSMGYWSLVQALNGEFLIVLHF